MNWEQLLSLQRHLDTKPRLRKEQDEVRLGFEVDYDRIIFSNSFRSLQDKTQVVPLPVQSASHRNFVHTRLTHSLEVSVVGRSLGRLAGSILLERHPNLKELGYRFNDFGAIVAAAALAHDIGNPPFGHSGEKAIGNYFESGLGKRFAAQLDAQEYADLCRFEGNANGFKLLTEDREGIPGGLRLSYATLGAFTKYPKPSLPHKPSKHIADKKYGYFKANQNSFESIATSLGLKRRADYGFGRHPLVYLVEAADDICYTLIDFEDAINLKLISEDYALENLINLVKDQIDTAKYRGLQTTADRLGYLRALAINTLVQDTVRIFESYESDILAGTFSTSLLDKSPYSAQVRDIIDLSVKYLYQSDEVIEKEIAGYRIIETLLDVFCTALINESDCQTTAFDRLVLKRFEFHQPMAEEESTYHLLLAASSFVASLSDSQAIQLHQTLKGIL
ncbi:MAG: dNTP triphosphohydrolase [Flavobacteriaceae bacterium]